METHIDKDKLWDNTETLEREKSPKPRLDLQDPKCLNGWYAPLGSRIALTIKGKPRIHESSYNSKSGSPKLRGWLVKKKGIYNVYIYIIYIYI